MKVSGSKIVPCQGVLDSNHSVTFGLFTQVSGSGPLGPLVSFCGGKLRLAEKIKIKQIKVTFIFILVFKKIGSALPRTRK